MAVSTESGTGLNLVNFSVYTYGGYPSVEDAKTKANRGVQRPHLEPQTVLAAFCSCSSDRGSWFGWNPAAACLAGPDSV